MVLDPAGEGVNVVFRLAEEGADVKGREVKITLSLTDVPLTEVLRYVAVLADCEVVKEEFAFVIRPKQAGKVPVPDADREKGGANAAAVPAPEKPEGAAMRKAGTIIFPKVDLRDATLSETVDFLRAKAKELDPDKLGVNLLLTPDAGGATTKITLGLKNVPLIEIIRYVTALAGCDFVADEHTITIRRAAK